MSPRRADSAVAVRLVARVDGQEIELAVPHPGLGNDCLRLQHRQFDAGIGAVEGCSGDASGAGDGAPQRRSVPVEGIIQLGRAAVRTYPLR
jgi:hypothetical protein